MTLKRKPLSLSLLGNLTPFEIVSSEDVYFRLFDGSELILDELYEASPSGSVIVDLKDILTNRLSFSLGGSGFYKQPSIAKKFTAEIGADSHSFTVVRSGVANLADTPANWLKGNFLTWQPTVKYVTYHSPEWITYFAQQNCTMKLRATFDNNTTQDITLGGLSAGSAYTANVQYARIAGLLGNKYPLYYDVWMESAGSRLSYVQRYVYSLPKSSIEQWYLFENTLGGIDTLRASGEALVSGDHDYNHSTKNEVSTQFKVEAHRNYTQNTGALDADERQWLLDLFPSYKKYFYKDGSFREIIITSDSSTYSASDTPSSFTFTYRFSDDNIGLLNLVRNKESVPENITLPSISEANFLIPPRLSEFPRVKLGEGVLIPAISPESELPSVTTVGELLAVLVAETLGLIPGSTEGGQLVKIITENSVLPGSDEDVFSSLRTKKEIDNAINIFAENIDNYLEALDEKFLSKINPDVAQSVIKFLQGAEFGDYVSGMLAGRGAAIDQRGNAEVESLRARGAIEAPEFIFNKLTVVGDEIIFSENGTIESVEKIEGDVYKLNMRLQDGELIGFQESDLIKGIFHHVGGFASSYMIVDEVAETYMKVTLAADEDTPTSGNIPPKDFMKVAHVGNAVVPERQRYIVASSESGGIQIYDGASTFLNGTLVGSMDAAQSFKGLYGDLPLRDGLFYLYAAGVVTQDIIRVDYEGVPVREIYDRGPWQPNRTYYNNDEQGTDDVWHLGCRWRCFSSSTTDEPSWTSQHWIMIEGRSDARMEFESSGGRAFFAGKVNTTITPIVLIGNTDVSSDIVAEQWSWSRDSGDDDSDLIWKVKNQRRRIITLKNEDMGSNWLNGVPVRFTCTAIYPASSINKVESHINFKTWHD